MIPVKCSKCAHEFQFDPRPQRVPENEVAKFASDVAREWQVLIVCPKCGHRGAGRVGEDGNP